MMPPEPRLEASRSTLVCPDGHEFEHALASDEDGAYFCSTCMRRLVMVAPEDRAPGLLRDAWSQLGPASLIVLGLLVILSLLIVVI